MSSSYNWGASLGSQFLAELSLIEAEVKIQNPDKRDSLAFVTDECGSNVVKGSKSQITVQNGKNSVKKVSEPLENKKVESRNSTSLGENFLLPSSNESLSLIVSTGPSQNSLTKSVRSPLSCSTPVNGMSIRKASLRSSTILQLQLQHWGLPPAVLEKYREKKITTLFPWQVDCLKTGQVLNRGNLVYIAPTSSGKTLVSELLMLKTVFEQKKKGI